VTFTDEERAELIAALSRTADMVAGLLEKLRSRLAGLTIHPPTRV
jgi:hypothetical protein